MKKVPKYLAGYQGECCWLCGRNGTGDPLDKHHIFNGAYRKKSERYGLTVLLCHNRCHENGPDAVHRNQDTDRKLKQYGQHKAMEENGWTIQDFIFEFGKNYLDETEEEEPEPEHEPSQFERMEAFAEECARKRRERLEVPEACFDNFA